MSNHHIIKYIGTVCSTEKYWPAVLKKNVAKLGGKEHQSHK